MGQGSIIGKPNLPATTSAKGVWSLREQSAANRASAWPGYDPYWSNTSMLLKTRTPADAAIDSSANSLAVTRSGDIVQTTNTPYASYWSNYFDGNGDSLSMASSAVFSPGTGDFTLECWVNPANWSSTYSGVFVVAANGGFWLGKNGSNFVLRAYAVADQISYGTLPTVGSWTHIVAVRSGATLSMYYNGTRVATTTNNYNFVQGPAYIADDGGGSYFAGNVSNLRLVKGTAVYDPTQTTLAVPTAPLTAVTNTSLLTCQDNRIKDNSTNSISITRNGDTVVSRFAPFVWAWSALNGGSAYFDGSGDYFTVGPNANLPFGPGDFTIECWVYATAASADDAVIWEARNSGGTSTGFVFNLRSNNAGLSNAFKLNFYTDGGANVSSTALTNNAWHHIAVTRSGSTIRLFSDGVIDATFTKSNNFSDNPAVTIGQSLLYGGSNFTGYIANLRVIKGSAAYTANFTPPTSPVTAISGTSLLLNFTNAAYRDTSGLASVIRQYGATTSRGTPAPSTELTNVGFAANGDYLSASAPSGYLGGGDFTVEGWVYPIAKVGAYPVMWCNYTSWAAGCFGLFIGHNSTPTKYTIGLNATDAVITSKSDIVYNQWTHLAAVRSNGVITLYVNGAAEGTYSTTTVFNQGTGVSFVSVPGDATTNSTFGGLVSNLRVERAARYTANFTPSTAPHTPTQNTLLILDQTPDVWDETRKNNFSNTGTLVSTPVLTGSALSLNGSQVARAYSGTLSNDFAFGTGPFTIEAWIYPTSTSNSRAIFSTRGTWASAIWFGLDNGTYTLMLYTDGYVVTSNTAVQPNVWSHVALVRTGGVAYLYINGTCVGSAANTTNYSQTVAGVGLAIGDSNYGWIGQLAEVRVTKAARYTGNFTVGLTPYSRDWEPPYNDALYANNVLQVKSIDVPGATNNVFRDDSNNNFLPVRYGDVTQGTLSPYVPTGYWSTYFSGTGGEYIVAPSTAGNLGAGDFTVEAWVFPVSRQQVYPCVFSNYSGGYSSGSFVILLDHSSALGKVAVGIDGAGFPTLSGPLVYNRWVHIAVVRSGGVITLYLNGISQGTYSSSATLNGNGTNGGSAWIGVSGDQLTNAQFNGHISNLRVVKSAVYTANFTPPTAPLTAIENTSLLTCQDNRPLDRSTSNFAITTSGAPAATRFAPYPLATPATTVATRTSGSFYFDGSGDYLTVPYSSAFDLSGGDWTMEAWFNAASFGGWHLVSKDTYGSNFDWSLHVANNTTLILYTYRTASSLTATVPAMSTNTWYHIAYVRQSGTNRIYLNGVQYASNTMAITNESQSYVTIGCYGWNNPGGYFPGYLSNLRIVKGTAIYPDGTTFTPPQTLTAVSGTSLLTAQNEFAFTDASSNNLTLTRYGDVLPTYKTPSGFAPKAMTYTYGGSGYFDGSGDYLMCPTGYLTNIGTGNFTIEGWWNFQDFTIRTTYYQRLWSFGTGTTNDVALNVSDTGYLTYRNNDAVLISASAPMILNTWAHVALVRNSGTTTLYLNGVSVGSTTTNNNLTTPAASPFYVGSEVGAGGYFIGHAANIRVTNTAVYTSAFTPPTSPVTAISGTSLLLNFDNAGVYDATGKQNILTRGASVTSNTRSKYETTTLAFNATDNTTITPVSATSHFAFGTGDFTIEFWLYRNTQNQEVFYDQRPYTTQGAYPTIYCEGATLYYYVGSGNRINGGTLAASTWYHIAVSRAASQTRLFVNGVQQGATYADTNSYLCGAGRPQLGNSYYNSTTEYRLNSYIEGLRVSRVGRYTANFTIPSEPFPMK